MAWEGAKKRERIDARIREEEIRRAEEARMRAEAEAEAEEEVVRSAEIEKFESKTAGIGRMQGRRWLVN